MQFFLPLKIPSMSAKSLGTPLVICTIDGPQKPLPFKSILFDGYMISTIGISNALANSKGPWLLIQHCLMGKGVYIFINASETGWEWKILKTV